MKYIYVNGVCLVNILQATIAQDQSKFDQISSPNRLVLPLLRPENPAHSLKYLRKLITIQG